MLVQAVHRCAVRFPDVAGAVVNLLMDFLGDANTATAFDVAMFVREIAQTNEHLRDEILKQLLDCFYSIRSSRVCGTCLWIVGEFSLTTGQIEESFETLKQSLGATPFLHPEEEALAVGGGSGAG
jgi:coatomer subunit beta